MAVLPQNKASGSVIPARLRIRKRLLCKSNTPASSKKMRFTVGDFDLLPERGMEVDEERCAIDPSYRAAIEYLEICTPGDICPEVFDGDLKYRNCVNILVGGVAAKQKTDCAEEESSLDTAGAEIARHLRHMTCGEIETVVSCGRARLV